MNHRWIHLGIPHKEGYPEIPPYPRMCQADTIADSYPLFPGIIDWYPYFSPCRLRDQVFHIQQIIKTGILDHETDIHNAVCLGFIGAGKPQGCTIDADHPGDLAVFNQALAPCPGSDLFSLSGRQPPTVHLHKMGGFCGAEKKTQGSCKVAYKSCAPCGQKGREKDKNKDDQQRSFPPRQVPEENS